MLHITLYLSLRRASGDPNLDSTEAEGVAIRGVVIPQFEEEYKQVSWHEARVVVD